jgi:hypothetical protein
MKIERIQKIIYARERREGTNVIFILIFDMLDGGSERASEEKRRERLMLGIDFQYPLILIVSGLRDGCC